MASLSVTESSETEGSASGPRSPGANVMSMVAVSSEVPTSIKPPELPSLPPPQATSAKVATPSVKLALKPRNLCIVVLMSETLMPGIHTLP